jgi:histidinol dehydrogenase
MLAFFRKLGHNSGALVQFGGRGSHADKEPGAQRIHRIRAARSAGVYIRGGNRFLFGAILKRLA